MLCEAQVEAAAAIARCGAATAGTEPVNQPVKPAELRNLNWLWRCRCSSRLADALLGYHGQLQFYRIRHYIGFGWKVSHRKVKACIEVLSGRIIHKEDER